MEKIENLKKNLVLPLQAGGVIGGVFGFASDFLQPIAPIGAILAAIAVVTLLLSMCIKVIPPLDQKLAERFQNFWYAPFAMTLILFSLVTYGANYISVKYGKQNNGVLATHVPGVESLQQSLGVIEKKLDEIKDNQVITHKKLDNISDGQVVTHNKIDQASEKQAGLITKNYDVIKRVEEGQANLKKETSTNPRKELANQGVSWNSESFTAALKELNTEHVRLFIEGSASALALYEGDNKFCSYMIKADPAEVNSIIDLLVQRGVDLNKPLYDGYETDSPLLFCSLNYYAKNQANPLVTKHLLDKGVRASVITDYVLGHAEIKSEFGNQNLLEDWYAIIRGNDRQAVIDEMDRIIARHKKIIVELKESHKQCVNKFVSKYQKICAEKKNVPEKGDLWAMVVPGKEEQAACMKRNMELILGTLCPENGGIASFGRKDSVSFLKFVQKQRSRMVN